MSLSKTAVQVPRLMVDFNTWNAFPEARLAKTIAVMQAMTFNFALLLREIKVSSKLSVPSVASCWLEILQTTNALVREWITPAYQLLSNNLSTFNVHVHTLPSKNGGSTLTAEVNQLKREINAFEKISNYLKTIIEKRRRNTGLDVQGFGLSISHPSSGVQSLMSRRSPSEMVLEALYRTHSADGVGWYEIPEHLRSWIRSEIDRPARVINEESWAGLPRTVNILFVNQQYLTGCSSVQYPQPFSMLRLHNVGPPSNTVLAWSNAVRDGRFRTIEKQLISTRLNLFRAEIRGVCNRHAHTRGQTWEIYLGESMIETLRTEMARRGRPNNFAQLARSQLTAAFDGQTLELKAPCK
ncbi:MAG: hypothetical protein Q9184_004154 [Pyrenodesmia sp. 2 TL-2023]